MPGYDVPVDQHGFPLPRGFDAETPSGAAPKKPKPPGRPSPVRDVLRCVVGAAVVIGLFALVFGEHAGKLFAQQFARQAEQVARVREMMGDFHAAREAADRALFWAEEGDRDLLALRARIRVRLGDADGALADYAAILDEHGQSVDVLRARTTPLLMLGRGQEAVDDCTRVVQLNGGGDPDAWNARAYIRAVAGVELDEALEDIERALEMLDGSPSQRDDGVERAMFLDTRGYVLHRLGRHEEALSDLDEAIELTVQASERWLTLLRMQGAHRMKVAYDERAFEEYLAVMRHHRGDVLEALGQREDARREKQLALDLGYSPETGVL